MTYLAIMSILAVHWFADFALQTDWQATNKSKNNLALAAHVGTYTAVLAAFAAITMPIIGIAWALLNGVIHFGVDYVTSRINSRLWSSGNMRLFFPSVGLDQLIHYACLFGTLYYLGLT